MALFGMPRGNATAWVSKPRHRSPPIRPGDTHSRAGPWLQDTPLRQLVESTSYQSARQKGRSRSEKRSATGACHHPHPSPPSVPEANIPRGPNQPCQIETPTWQASSRPNPAFRKNQKNNLFRSDTTDPGDSALMSVIWDWYHLHAVRSRRASLKGSSSPDCFGG
jgi:hypothetical protein